MVENPWEYPQVVNWFKGQSIDELSGRLDEDIPVVGTNYLDEYKELPWISLQENYPQSWQSHNTNKTGFKKPTYSVSDTPYKSRPMQGLKPDKSSEPKYGEFEVQNLAPGLYTNRNQFSNPHTKPYSDLSKSKQNPDRKPKHF